MKLPALPKGGLKASKQYNYLSLPKDMSACTYLLRFKECKQFTSEKANTEKLSLTYEVLETDTKMRVGVEASDLLDLQGERAIYFWKNFSVIVLSFMGIDVTDEELSKFEEDAAATYKEVVSNNSLAGLIARISYRAGKNKEGKDTFYTDWSVATPEEIAEHT